MAAQPPRTPAVRNVGALRGGLRTRDLPPPPPLPDPAPVPPAAEPAPAPTKAAPSRPRPDRTDGDGRRDTADEAGGAAADTEADVAAGAGRSRAGAERGARGGGRRPARRTAATKSRAAAKLADEDTRPVAVYLPAELKAEVVSAAQRAGETLGEWLLDAYDGAFDRLEVMLTREAEEAGQRRSGLPARRVRRRTGPVSVQAQFYLTGKELRVLDAHRERLGVDSRSEFFTLIAQLGLG